MKFSSKILTSPWYGLHTLIWLLWAFRLCFASRSTVSIVLRRNRSAPTRFLDESSFGSLGLRFLRTNLPSTSLTKQSIARFARLRYGFRIMPPAHRGCHNAPHTSALILLGKSVGLSLALFGLPLNFGFYEVFSWQAECECTRVVFAFIPYIPVVSLYDFL